MAFWLKNLYLHRYVKLSSTIKIHSHIKESLNLGNRHISSTFSTGLDNNESSYKPESQSSYKPENINHYDVIRSPIRKKESNIVSFCKSLNDLNSSNILSDQLSNVIQHDKVFNANIDDIGKRITSFDSSTVLISHNALRSILPADHEALKSIELQILWLIKDMAVPEIFKTYGMFNDLPRNELRGQICKLCYQSLEQKCSEITIPKHILSAMYIAHESGSKNLVKSLETNAKDVCFKFSGVELYRMIYTLAKMKQRNSPLIKSLCYYFKKSEYQLQPIHITNMFFSLTRLNIFDEQLLLNLSEQVINTFDETTDIRLVHNILSSIGLLKWKYTLLVDKLASLILNSKDTIPKKHIVNLFVTCANLNYLPQFIDTKFDHMIDDIIKNHTSIGHKLSVNWIKCVWSSAILEKATNEMYKSVLDDECALDFAGNPALIWRLNVINNAAKYDSNSYDGPFLSPSLLKNDKAVCYEVTENKPTEKYYLKDDVLNTFMSFIPSDEYIRSQVSSLPGHIIDFELRMNSKGEIEKLDYDNSKGDGYRIAVLTLDFDDLTLFEKGPTGLTALKIRHLKNAGYKVVLVEYHILKAKSQQIVKVEYLQSLLKSAIEF